MKPLQSMDENDLYELLVQFDLLDLATKLNDAQITGKNFLDLKRFIADQEIKIERFLNPSEDDEHIYMDLAQVKTLQQLIDTWQESEPKHKDLLRALQLAMHDLNEKLYERQIAPSSKYGLGESNVPPALWELVDEDVGSMGQGSSHENIYIQQYLLKLWRLISQHRRTNTQSEGLSIIKQEFFLDFIAFYLNSENLMSLISQLLINWSRGSSSGGGTGEDENDPGNAFTAQHELHMLLSGFIRGSNNPLSTALQMASFLEEISVSFPEIEEETKQLSVECQKMAINVLDSISSNRLAIILLESNDSLDIALEGGLEEFISSETVGYLRTAIWTRCSAMLLPESDIDNGEVDQGGEISTWISSMFGNYFHILTLEHGFSFVFELLFTTKYQLNWFLSPIGKIQTEFFIYLIYCVLLYMTVVQEREFDAYAETSIVEIWFWICNGSFILAEIRNAGVVGISDYLGDKENWIDMFIDANYIIIFILRILGFFRDILPFMNDCDPTDNKGDHEDACMEKPINTAFALFYTLLIMGIICRISYMVLVFYNMGFLVRSLITMTGDIMNFLVFVFLWIFGFALALYMGTFGAIEGYGSIGDAFRTLFYAMLGDFNWDVFSEDTEDPTNPLTHMTAERRWIVEIVFIVWLTFGLVIFLNFIIAVMGKRFDTVQEEVNKYVSMHRMNVLRGKDELPATIPAPFQTILPIFEVVWFYAIEPAIWLFTGQIVNVEYFLCRFDHWDEYDKHHRTHGKHHKNQGAIKRPTSWLMTPHFVEYRDQIKGMRLVLPRTFWDRVKALPRAMKEMKTGMFFTGNSKDELSDPFIWICTYCCYINVGFDQEMRRKNEHSDVIRYYRYNDTLPPEFGFSDRDIQFLEHIRPTLCDNCFRVKHWEQRILFIDALVSFYLYNLVSFLCVRVWLGLFMLGLFIGLTLLSVCFSLLLAIIGLLIWIVYKGVDFLCNCLKCCNKQTQAVGSLFSFTDNEGHDDDNNDNNDPEPDDLLSIGSPNGTNNNTDDASAEEKKALEHIKEQKEIMRRQFFIDYRHMYDNTDYELMLLVPQPKLTQKQSEALKDLLTQVVELTGLEAQRDNMNLKTMLNLDILIKRLQHNSDPIYNICEMVDEDIIHELSTRIVIVSATYQACAKFKECLDKLLYLEQSSNGNKNSNSFANWLPEFQLKLLASRYSVEANWGNSDESDYHGKIRTRASKQTRSKYEFSFTPVMKTINNAP